jgi:hypothetical protein
MGALGRVYLATRLTSETPADFLLALVRRVLQLTEKLRHAGILRVERGEPAQVAMGLDCLPVLVTEGCKSRQRIYIERMQAETGH